ncbi:hypothetical protein C0991_005708 [Blastosporella zonata]|nr:hypothetical protein C0991_005708 [Blastosporella zonata]
MTEQFYKTPEFETIQLHGGQQPDPATNARAVPVYASTSFHAVEIFALKYDLFTVVDWDYFRLINAINSDPAYSYSRLANPTVDVFEKRIAQLEGGAAAIATSSGQSAQFLAIGAIARVGDNIVSS